jgi:hypothetical protein
MWAATNSEELWEASRSPCKAPLACFRCQGSQKGFKELLEPFTVQTLRVTALQAN